MIIPRVPVQHRRLLPDRRLSGPTPWVIAILMMLTLLAAAAGVGLARSANAIGSAIAGRVTVQIVTANPVTRAQQAAALRRAAAAQPFVLSARAVDREELQATLGQWFGSADEGDPVLNALPLPALVDIDFVGDNRSRQMQQLRALVAAEAPGARIIPHAEWLGPVARLIGSLAWIAGGLVLLMTLASAAVVIMTARAALGTHFATIEMLHLIGATDRQITRLFQRRIAIDTAYGIALGTAVAAALLLLIGWQWSGVTSGLAATASLGPTGWALLLALPLLAIALAALTARQTLLAALKKIL
ncbi:MULTISPECIES: cell division protein [unclassified Sphingopyxis]|jgi:cell division transport system permease protein|uniref:cell division protein FtsX n=1 Tax=unclassified Sphingopyxis TaxID=2614943 RepID=UPI002867A663|nr:MULTISPECIES: cell division protein [unclassified Sphingopyxis]MDR6833413.1 cell division transport system permease protein [Sphingopyxis sp. BE122]MDR7225682.1 cell division transport system permease protein [Sphingopyxis sp. BE259]